MTLRYQVFPRPDPLPAGERDRIKANPGFGGHFSDHMVVCRWSVGAGWGSMEIVPYGPLTMSPAAMGIHYGQAILEGLKVYCEEDGTHALFRPDRNAERMRLSASRLAMPELPPEDFIGSCALLAAVDRGWVPSGYGTSLYLRPWMFATEEHLGVRPSEEYVYGVVACPVAPFFSVDPVPVTIFVELGDVRAAVGGTGEAKFAGNYAAALRAHSKAKAAGFDQVLWLDAKEHRWIEELNGMNIFFVWEEGGRQRVTTPPLGGTLLRGITRESIITLLTDLGVEVAEEPTSLDDVRAGSRSGRLTEALACGTAAVVAPIGKLVAGEDVIEIGGGVLGNLTQRIRTLLLDLQHGREEDTQGWVQPVEGILADLGIADLVPAEPAEPTEPVALTS